MKNLSFCLYVRPFGRSFFSRKARKDILIFLLEVRVSSNLKLGCHLKVTELHFYKRISLWGFCAKRDQNETKFEIKSSLVKN